jgi:hypothetical protein
MASMPFKAQTVKFSINFALPHCKTTPNPTLLVGVAAPCANWALMGLDTFVAAHLSHVTTLGFTNEFVVPEISRHNTPLVFTSNLNKVKFGLNLATFAFVINPFCV